MPYAKFSPMKTSTCGHPDSDFKEVRSHQKTMWTSALREHPAGENSPYMPT